MPHNHERIADVIFDMIKNEGASKQLIANYLALVYKDVTEVKKDTWKDNPDRMGK
jgi:hypothetical protein